MPEEGIQFTTPAGLIGDPVIELDNFSFQLEADQEGGVFEVIGGVFPDGLTLSSGGLISGTVQDLDLYVPEFQMPPGFVIERDGSNYATWGSAQAGGFDCEFTVRVTSSIDSSTAERNFIISVENNWSSDRNQLIRDYSDVYGIEGPDTLKRIFQIGSIRVTAPEYLCYREWDLCDDIDVPWIYYDPLTEQWRINFSGLIDFDDTINF